MKKLIAMSTLLFSSAVFAAGAPTITGKWHFQQDVAGNKSEQNCEFVQAEATLTGSCKGTGEDDKDVQIKGTVDGNKITFQYDTSYNGTALTMKYAATLDDSGKMAGTIVVDPFNVNGEFTAAPSGSESK
ncbi:MAG: hypothetical protein JST28_08985 [Acidobacteria bacterium]|nr:hypothetical protein [Acidobacteriota bacterium]